MSIREVNEFENRKTEKSAKLKIVFQNIKKFDKI
jgi:hypothetical protein